MADNVNQDWGIYNNLLNWDKTDIWGAPSFLHRGGAFLGRAQVRFDSPLSNSSSLQERPHPQ